MKKFTLIKTYPGSPKLDSIVIENTDHSRRVYLLKCKVSRPVLSPDLIETQPEFWEEVIEKDYEILSVIYDNKIYTRSLNNKFLDKDTYILENALKCPIHSIKRIKDNKVFTIGDNANTKLNTWGFITLFEVYNNRLYVRASEHVHPTYTCEIKDLKAIKKPLFTTKDGVKAYEGDKYWCIDKNKPTSIYTYGTYSNGKIRTEEFYFFSTKEAAEEYILMNKPCLSINDICPIIGQVNMTTYIDLNRLTTKLKNIIRLKSE